MVDMVQFTSLWNDNWSQDDIAKHFGVTRRTIQNIVSENGLSGRFDFWERNDARLRELWPMWPASQIAAELGTTRNAVIGRARRINLEEKRNTGGGRPRQNSTLSSGRMRIRNRLMPVRRLITLEPEPDNANLVEFLDLESHHCRYPIEDKFCGQKMLHRSYCAYHARVCYRAPYRGTIWSLQHDPQSS